MSVHQPSARKEKLKKATHILAAVIILSHAYEKFENDHNSYIYFLVAGIVFLSIALFHHPLKVRFPWIDNCFFIIESILSLIIAFDFYHMGKTGLPIIYLLAALLQLSGVYFLSRKMKRR